MRHNHVFSGWTEERLDPATVARLASLGVNTLLADSHKNGIRPEFVDIRWLVEDFQHGHPHREGVRVYMRGTDQREQGEAVVLALAGKGA